MIQSAKFQAEHHVFLTIFMLAQMGPALVGKHLMNGQPKYPGFWKILSLTLPHSLRHFVSVAATATTCGVGAVRNS